MTEPPEPSLNDTVEAWVCDQPPRGVKYRVIRDKWIQNYSVRLIYEIKTDWEYELLAGELRPPEHEIPSTQPKSKSPAEEARPRGRMVPVHEVAGIYSELFPNLTTVDDIIDEVRGQ